MKNNPEITIKLVGNHEDDKVEIQMDTGELNVLEDTPINRVFALIIDAIKRSQ